MNRESNMSSASTSPLLSSSCRGSSSPGDATSHAVPAGFGAVERQRNGDGAVRLENSIGTTGVADRATYYRSHDYEELPSIGYSGSGYANQDYGYSVADDSSPTTALGPGQQPPASLFTPSTASPLNIQNGDAMFETLLHNNNGYRKRINPLYASLPSPTASRPKDRRSHCCRNFLLTFLCVLVVLFNSVACSAFIVLYRSGYFSPETSPTSDRIAMMESRYDFLVKVLNGSLSAGNDSDVSLLREQISAFVRRDFESELNGLKMEFASRIENISLIPGPPGPSGTGNLTQCKHEVKTVAQPADLPRRSETVWVPATLDEAEVWQITGIACFTDGGTSSYLETQVLPDADAMSKVTMQYRCICDGKLDKTITSRFCYLHYWMCPMLT